MNQRIGNELAECAQRKLLMIEVAPVRRDPDPGAQVPAQPVHASVKQVGHGAVQMHQVEQPECENRRAERPISHSRVRK